MTPQKLSTPLVYQDTELFTPLNATLLFPPFPLFILEKLIGTLSCYHCSAPHFSMISREPVQVIVCEPLAIKPQPAFIWRFFSSSPIIKHAQQGLSVSWKIRSGGRDLHAEIFLGNDRPVKYIIKISKGSYIEWTNYVGRWGQLPSHPHVHDENPGCVNWRSAMALPRLRKVRGWAVPLE